ncbi:MAG TPA: fructose-specific PTS transporter subunit EIIC [Solirubrobacteraceae bacterium]|nr:fructose-specific PTS transporter subunit EIIC [Solirubrobacteraceae bacterium]
MKLVAVTSCPTGIAHTYMAAEAIEQAAKAAGHEIAVETQGAAGATPLAPEVIAAADAVIFAADVEVRNRERFAGKPLVTASVKRGINDAGGLIADAEQRAAEGVKAEAAAPASASAGLGTKVEEGAGIGTRLRQWLMTGVSYMIPFVAAGGILIALSFLFGGASIATKVNGGTFQGHMYAAITDPTKILDQVGFAGVMFFIGSTAFKMLVPILAGFIAFAMADRPGLVPGIVAGLLAIAVGAGFLGGLLGGLIAGAVTLAVLRLRVPRALAGVMPVVIIPLVTTLIVGTIMIVVIGQPIASAQKALTDWLNGLSGTNGILLGALIGAMMAFDMGGPVNKVAYTFGLASLASGNLKIMAAVMAAGMVPPVAMALATVVRPKLFNDTERKAGEAAWLLGASFITEGAIPFAAADPLRVIPSIMAGSALTGALSMAFGATSRAPHGGIWVVGLIGRPGLYVLAIGAGVLLATAIVVALKSMRHTPPIPAEPEDLLGAAATVSAPREVVAA